MDLRRKLNENPMIAAAIVGVVVIVAIWVIFSFSGSSGAGGDTYYSTDDGATWFSSSNEDLPPFDKGGQQAVRAYLFKCPDGKEFVAYLEKYTDEAKTVIKQLKEAKGAEGQMPDGAKIQAATSRGRLVKKPGDKEWTNSADSGAAMKILQVKCPDGSPAFPVR